MDVVGAWITQNPTWTDAILGISMIIQGELTILLSMYLAISGKITWLQFFVPTLGAIIIAETFIYILGRTIRNTRFGWKLSKKIKGNKRVQTYTYYLRQNMTKLLIITKFIPATNLMIMALIGWSKTKFAVFFKSYLKSVFLWFGSMAIVAYFLMSGIHYLQSSKVFKQVEIAILVIFILIFAGEHVLSKMLKKYAAVEEKAGLIGEAVDERWEEKEKKEGENKNP